MTLVDTLTRSSSSLTSIRAHLLPLPHPTPTIAHYTQPSTTPHDALLTLLKHTRQEITSLSLAFSGKTILVPAAESQAKKVEDDYSRLVAVVLGLSKGSCLFAEWAKEVGELGEEIGSLFSIFIEDAGALDDASSSSTSAPTTTTATTTTTTTTGKTPPKPYLIQTKQIWTHIDHLILTISPSEPRALLKLWQSDQGCIKDAFEEYKELLEVDEGVGRSVSGDDEEGEGDDEGDEGDDEWADLERELQGGDQEEMTPDERDRIASLDTPIRLLITLHTHYLRTTLLLPHALSLPTHLELSHTLTSHLDTLVSSLYTPQVEDEVEKATEEAVGVGMEIVGLSLAVIGGKKVDGLGVNLESLRVSEDQDKGVETAPAVEKDLSGDELGKPSEGELEGLAKEEKWLRFWKDQMEKAVLARKAARGATGDVTE